MSFQCITGFVTISAFDLEKMAQFYQQLFQQEPEEVVPHSYVEFHVGSLQLGIFRPHKDHKEEFATVGKNPMSICLEVDNLDAAIDRLKSLGYAPPGPIIHAAHGREIYAYDSEQNRLIIHQSKSLI